MARNCNLTGQQVMKTLIIFLSILFLTGCATHEHGSCDPIKFAKVEVIWDVNGKPLYLGSMADGREVQFYEGAHCHSVREALDNQLK